MNDIQANLTGIRYRIAEAARRSGRDPEEITLVAVTKLHEPEEIEAAASAGIENAAENKVQELVRKQPLVKADLTWHLIGHLQTNKVKQIIDKVSLIQSVDSLHLAEEIEKRAAAAGKVQDILIQINAAEEAQKSGVSVAESEQLIRDVSQNYKHVNIKGLMFIAPAAEDPEEVRGYFRQVKLLYDRYQSLSLERVDMKILSMGMSGDFEVAIEEGSNMVRIGTAIFGKRDYSKE